MSVPPPESSIPPYNTLGVSQDDKTMAMLAELLPIVTGFLGPLVIWLIKKDQSKFVAFHAMQALFFHLALNVVMFVLGITIILALAAPAVWLVGIIFSVIAGLAANRGEWYELPVVGKIARQQVGI
jgi:uncharacterized membrane protein